MTIVFVKMLERSLMPWIVASQTVPIIALAPMIVVILNQFNIGGMTPKAVIAAYLSFFPITVGIVKGLRSPETLQLDLMRTYSATPAQTLFKLRAPASAPFFFASMKIGAAAALVGAVVAEVTKSEDGGLGARLLAGSYYGQTVQIWAALFTAAALSGAAGRRIGLIGRIYAAPDGVHVMNAQKLADLVPPLLFGLAVLALWEAGVRLAGVPAIILPAPSAIALRFVVSVPTLAADFVQTMRGMLAGYLIGNAAGLFVAVLIDRSPFLQRGLLPLGNLVSALPIVGVAPIMVMWFGFDWQSKAAVVVIMTFFPMLVNAAAGLVSAGAMERDLMKTYAASYEQTLLKLRLPAALPFVFNALKINTTLAMIGAIVAEFFGTPTVGMGFRISTEVGHLKHRHGVGDDRRRRRDGLGFLCADCVHRTARYILARLVSREVSCRGGEGNEEIGMGIDGDGGDVGRRLGAGGRQGDVAAQVGDAGPVRRLLRRQGQGLLQGREPRRDDQAGRA